MTETSFTTAPESRSASGVAAGALGSDARLFAQRRARLLDALEDNAALVLFATPLAVRNNDVEHDFRQDSDLFYLSGFGEPESVLVLRKSQEPRFVLLVRPRDPERETWDGRRAGVEGAKRDFGADEAYPMSELGERLGELLTGVETVYYPLGRFRQHDDQLLAAVARARNKARRGGLYPIRFVDPVTVLHEQRLHKAPEEVAAMRRAIAITGEAHRAAMAACRPGMYEYEIEALLFAKFRALGAGRLAYSSIVGGGPNATILHYHENSRRLEDGDLLLIDAGCEYDYYASDVTRTFPVNGRFEKPQRQLYELVLEAQLASIAATKPGNTLDDVHHASFETITRGLIELGVLEGPLDKALEDQRAKALFMHRTSHFLGMDVHDVGRAYVGALPRPLEPGMVITVEPGIYVGEALDRPQATSGIVTAALEPYRGIGIRIEDDVLVTDTGCDVLSAGIPKTVADVEHACRA